ncbi:hypothetical protein FQA39_LY09754 [Lamprigera yunnana]|nr:hypothetical protein FQA39_LY09754 [Lamprigera yunnana]
MKFAAKPYLNNSVSLKLTYCFCFRRFEIMTRYHIYKIGLAIIAYTIYFERKLVVNGAKIDGISGTLSTTDYRERRDAGDFHSNGTPNVDFPTYSHVPKTKFSCKGMEAGYYADLETDCQVFHICDEGRKLSFLCPNGTVFQQGELICDWWFKVNCTTSPLLYEESAEILQRENAKRKSHRKTHHGTKQGIFSSHEDYNSRDTLSTTEGFSHKYTSRGDRRIDAIRYNNNGNEIEKSYSHRDNYVSSKHTKVEPNPLDKLGIVIGPNNKLPLKVNDSRNKVRVSSYGNSIKETSGEAQELQETASFVTNSRNRVPINNKSYPNHRETYSEIKDPRQYYQVHSKFPEKPFYGSSVSPQVLSTVPISFNFRRFSHTTEANKNTIEGRFSYSFKTNASERKQNDKVILTTSSKSIAAEIDNLVSNDVTKQTQNNNSEHGNIKLIRISEETDKSFLHTYTSPPTTTTTATTTSTTTTTTAATTASTTTASSTTTTTPAISKSAATKLGSSSATTTQKSTIHIASVDTTTHSSVNDLFTTSKAIATTNQLVSSSILQPKPFSLNSNIQHSMKYPLYKTSSSSPFVLNVNASDPLGLSIAISTQPTPFDYYHSTTPSSVQENVNHMIETLINVMQQKINPLYDSNTPTPDLIIPPSVGPETLHSLAIYFANALDNRTVNTSEQLAASLPVLSNEELIKDLLTQMTRNNYDNLFKTTTEQINLPVEDESEVDLSNENSNNLVPDVPNVRVLARVFTEALSAYLEDPETFKKVLHQVRPTEPPFLHTDTTDSDEDEVLNYSDSDLKADHHYLHRPTESSNIPTWGYVLALNATPGIDLSRNLLAPEPEKLQSADSQSFISQLNKIAKEPKTTPTTVDANALSALPTNHWTSSKDVEKLWQNTLSINPALLNSNFYSENVEASTASEENSDESVGSEIQYDLRSLPKIELNSTQVHGILIDFMHTNKTNGTEKLQRLLQKLNISENQFLERMKEVEENPFTRRLILLLINECSSNKDQVEPRDLSDEEEKELNAPHSETVFKELDPKLKTEDEDTRALHLLNSLYVIASKFGK